MQVSKVQNNNYNQNFQAGLYFYRKDLSGVTVWYETLHNKATSIISEEGIEYLPDFSITNKNKKRISEIPFIKKLAREVDTFVKLTIDDNSGKSANNSDKFVANITITWNDTEGGHTRRTCAGSNSSSGNAVTKLLKKVTNEEFFVNDLM